MSEFTVSSERLKEITGNFKSAKVMVIGDIMIDEYMWGSVDRISPEAPVPVVAVDKVTTRLGGAANVVQNLSKIGVTPVLVSVCGNDYNGKQLGKMLSGIKCSPEYVYKSQDRPTTIKTRIMARQQQVVRADRELCSDLSGDELKEVLTNFEKALSGVNGVVISDYGKGVICPVFLENIITACNEKNLFIAVDPKERHFDLYKGVTVITPNLKEAHTALGILYNKNIPDEQIEMIGWQIIEKYKLSYLLLTLSERGMALLEGEDKRFTHLSTVAKKVYDVTGAGDTVISIFSAAIICGASPREAAFIANHAAGLTVSEIGTASVDVDSLLKACQR